MLDREGSFYNLVAWIWRHIHISPFFEVALTFFLFYWVPTRFLPVTEMLKFFIFWQLGHNIEKVREKMRELTKQIVQAYSAAKSFPYILEGLRSKNNRTRIECADLVGYLIDHHGAEVDIEMTIFAFIFNLYRIL